MDFIFVSIQQRNPVTTGSCPKSRSSRWWRLEATSAMQWMVR